MNGVTSKGIFSRSETRPTGLVFNISIWPDQGSTLTRPPRGSAAMTTLGCEPEAVEGAEPGRSEAGVAATLDGEKGTRLPGHGGAELVGNHHGQAGFVGENVDQAAAENDGAAEGEGFQGGGEHDAAANPALDVEVIGDFEVVDDGFGAL